MVMVEGTELVAVTVEGMDPVERWGVGGGSAAWWGASGGSVARWGVSGRKRRGQIRRRATKEREGRDGGAMAMADCYYVRDQQLEEDAVVHRFLPPEILVEIGIAADHAAAHDAVVEELAARLVGILGLTSSAAGAGRVGEKNRAAAAATPPPTTSATPPCGHPQPQLARREQHLAGGGVINGGMVRYHAPGYGTTQWLPPPASFAGTGVFLPRGEVYPYRKQVRNRRIC
uniref:Uncharacterized protein n=1 Tax=Oryza punctata TaxID=4537 RepID=A0A0E0MCP8_ORYPU